MPNDLVERAAVSQAYRPHLTLLRFMLEMDLNWDNMTAKQLLVEHDAWVWGKDEYAPAAPDPD